MSRNRSKKKNISNIKNIESEEVVAVDGSFKATEFVAFMLAVFTLSFCISFFISGSKMTSLSALASQETEKVEDTFTLGEAANEQLNHQDLNELYEQNKEATKQLIEDRKNGKNPVIILGYHQIREYKKSDGKKTKLFITLPETFEKEMKYLFDAGYKTITTTEYLNYLKDSENVTLPEKSLVLTFDDGYASQYETALPILKKYNFTATFYIYKNCIDRFPACMTTDNIKSLIGNGMMIGNHTLDHANLPKSSEEGIKRQIAENKKWLYDTFATSSIENIFVYPYGAQNEKVKDIVKAEGYDAALGIKGGYEKDMSHVYNMHRYLLGDDYREFEGIFK